MQRDSCTHRAASIHRSCQLVHCRTHPLKAHVSETVVSPMRTLLSRKLCKTQQNGMSRHKVSKLRYPPTTFANLRTAALLCTASHQSDEGACLQQRPLQETRRASSDPNGTYSPGAHLGFAVRLLWLLAHQYCPRTDAARPWSSTTPAQHLVRVRESPAPFPHHTCNRSTRTRLCSFQLRIRIKRCRGMCKTIWQSDTLSSAGR